MPKLFEFAWIALITEQRVDLKPKTVPCMKEAK